MKCPNCGHEGTGKFCVKCGKPLQVEATENHASSTQAATIQIDTEQLNKHVESVKEVSKNYFNYFLTVLKNPFTRATHIHGQQWMNGVITIVLYSLFIALFTFILLGGLRSSISSPFFNIVLKPTIGYFVFMTLIALFTFLSAKLMKLNWSFLDVYVKFGTLLVPFVALFLISIVLAILQAKMFAFLLLFFGMTTANFLIPATILFSHRQESRGLDRFYAIAIVYLLTFISVAILGEILLSSLMNIIADVFMSPFDPFSLLF